MPIQPMTGAVSPALAPGVYRSVSTAVGSSAMRRVPPRKVLGDVAVAADDEIAPIRQSSGGSARAVQPDRIVHVEDARPAGQAFERCDGRQQLTLEQRDVAAVRGDHAGEAGCEGSGQPDRPRPDTRRRIRTETPPLDHCHVELRQWLDELPNAESRARRVEACGEGRDPGHLVTSSGAAASSGGSRPTSSIAGAGAMTPRRVSGSAPSLSAVDRLLRYTIMNGRNDVNRKSCNGT